MHTWGDNTFMKIGAMFGTVPQVEDQTKNKAWLDRGSVCVRLEWSSTLDPIQYFIPISVYGS